MATLQLLFIALCAVTSSLACSCMPDHPQKQFCDADFVVLAYVTSPPKDEFMPNRRYPMPYKEQVYTLRVRETFKGHAYVKTDRAKYAKIYTPPGWGSCRVNLQQRVDYLLSGKIVGGNMYVRFCNWWKKWSYLTPEQQLGVRTLYSKGCECSIGFCFSPKCQNLLTGCEGYDRNVDNFCRAKYQRCEKQISFNGERKCAWVGSKMCSQRSVFFP